MAADTAVAASPEETLESLLREAEALKQKLEEERQKLNDVSRKCDAKQHSLYSYDTRFSSRIICFNI